MDRTYVKLTCVQNCYYHWQSLVAVNARHVLHPDHAAQDEVAGFFMLDSILPPGKERKVKGLKVGSPDDFNVQTGFKYFLNLANYHVAKENAGRDDFTFSYVSEPFGEWCWRD